MSYDYQIDMGDTMRRMKEWLGFNTWDLLPITKEGFRVLEYKQGFLRGKMPSNVGEKASEFLKQYGYNATKTSLTEGEPDHLTIEYRRTN